MAVEVGTDKANVKTFGDALWLGVMTISTVGFGDHYATTNMGRILTVLMIMSGPIVLGAFFAVGQSLIKTDANITNREIMSVLMELHRQIDNHKAVPSIVTEDDHGLDKVLDTRPWLNNDYDGWLSIGQDNMNIYKISFHANSRKVNGLPLVRHVYAGDDFNYAQKLFQYYQDNRNVY